MLKALSLGAGVQSSTLLLMACRGEIEKPHLAIFADTGWEPKAVYQWLDFLKEEAAKAGIPILTVQKSNLRQDILNHNRKFVDIPLYIIDEQGKRSMLKRQCTSKYKVRPVRVAARKAMKEHGFKKIELWMGISTDEITRAKPSGLKYITNRFPLIERGISRAACLEWLAARGFPQAPKSSCIGCPYHDNAYWLQLKNNPEEFADAVEVDRAIRRMSNREGMAFLHRNTIPLEEIQPETTPYQLVAPLFEDLANECEGMCGV
jgi:hypothetical protein